MSGLYFCAGCSHGLIVTSHTRIALQIAKNAPIAVRAAKEAVKRGMEEVSMHDALEVERECYARTLPTKDRQEGLAAFREGRDPHYEGH